MKVECDDFFVLLNPSIGGLSIQVTKTKGYESSTIIFIKAKDLTRVANGIVKEVNKSISMKIKENELKAKL